MGTKEAGKSTLLTQLNFFCGRRLTEDDRGWYLPNIYQNVQTVYLHMLLLMMIIQLTLLNVSM
jgi:hypothetical protein